MSVYGQRTWQSAIHDRIHACSGPTMAQTCAKLVSLEHATMLPDHQAVAVDYTCERGFLELSRNTVSMGKPSVRICEITIRNLLRGLLSGCLLGGSLGRELAVDVSLSESLEDRSLSLGIGDLAGSHGQLSALDGDDILVCVLGNAGELSTGGVTSLGLASGSGEHKQLGLELLDAVHVGGSSLFTLVASSLVHGETDSAGELHGNTGLLQLRGGETSTLADLEVVTLSGRHNDRSQQTSDRSGEHSGSLGLTSQTSGLMASWLVEPSSNISVVLRKEEYKVLQ